MLSPNTSVLFPGFLFLRITTLVTECDDNEVDSFGDLNNGHHGHSKPQTEYSTDIRQQNFIRHRWNLVQGGVDEVWQYYIDLQEVSFDEV